MWSTDLQCIRGQNVIDCTEVLNGVSITSDSDIVADHEDAVNAEDGLHEFTVTSTADTGTALDKAHAHAKDIKRGNTEQANHVHLKDNAHVQPLIVRIALFHLASCPSVRTLSLL